MQHRSHVMDQKTAVYGVLTKKRERRIIITVSHSTELHHRLVRLIDRVVVPARLYLEDLPALSRLRKINKSLLDLQTLLLELLIPASDGLSKTLDNVEIHLKSPRYPETRVLFLFFEHSAHAADKLVLHVTLTRGCVKEVKTRENLRQGRLVPIPPLSVISATGTEPLFIPTKGAVVASRYDSVTVVIYLALEKTHDV